jgi:hypothetical protein
MAFLYREIYLERVRGMGEVPEVIYSGFSD